MKRYSKPIALLLTSALMLLSVFVSIDTTAINAKADTYYSGHVVLDAIPRITTQDGFLWKKPNMSDKYFVSALPAGSIVSIKPKVVYSTAGDYKVFYETTDGYYILNDTFGDVIPYFDQDNFLATFELGKVYDGGDFAVVVLDDSQSDYWDRYYLIMDEEADIYKTLQARFPGSCLFCGWGAPIKGTSYMMYFDYVDPKGKNLDNFCKKCGM